MKPIAPNTLIQNRYLIVHLIGKGGMGEVYLAVDQRLGSAIALKRTFFSDDATLGHAFEREARTLARLRHPVLPKVSDHFTEEGTQYLVMEHISGEDISKRLETAEKLFPISWVLFWADQLLDSLNYLHSHEPPIIHRDIKPQNLKLTDENHIVLLDFGLSKNSTGETRATTGGSIVGYTPHYASMEQIRGTGTDARSDLYSLAATLYQILTNNVPPDALTRADSLINGLPDPVTPISDLNPEVSKSVSDVILKGMAISQEQRYKTAREMQKALRDAYAQMQTDMTANTVVLNTASLAAAVPPAAQKTEQFSIESVAQQMPAQPQTSPTAYNSGATGAKVNTTAPPASGSTAPNFDATVRYDSEVPEPGSKQADIRTEVFLAGSSSPITKALEENHPRQDTFTKPDGNGDFGDFAAEQDFSTKSNAGKPSGFSPDATVPLFTFEKDEVIESKTNGFDSTPERGNGKTATGATYTAADSGAPSGGTYAPAGVVAAPPKSGGKGLMIAGGLVALLVLAVGAVGIGWYLTRDGKTTTDGNSPTPKPEATATVVPTAEPTVEVVTDTNTSTSTEISSGDNTSGSDNTNSAPNGVVTTRPTPNRGETTVQPTPPRSGTTATPRPTPQIVTVKTPPPAKTPPPTKTPKGGRTDILQ